MNFKFKLEFKDKENIYYAKSKINAIIKYIW